MYNMHWTVELQGGPRRVNHAAVYVPQNRKDCVNNKYGINGGIFSFGGYCTGNNYRDINRPIDVFHLNIDTYRWTRIELDKRHLRKRYRLNSRDSSSMGALHSNSSYDRRRDSYSYGLFQRRHQAEAAQRDSHDEDRTADLDGQQRRRRRRRRDESNRYQVPCWPFQRYGHTVVFREKSRVIYVFGGINDRYPVCRRIYRFDPDKLEWLEPESISGLIPPARDGHASCVIDDCMYVYGGAEQPFSWLSAEVYKFDFHQKRWSKVNASINNSVMSGLRRDFHTAVCLIREDEKKEDNCFYVFGGRQFDVFGSIDRHVNSLNSGLYRHRNRREGLNSTQNLDMEARGEGNGSDVLQGGEGQEQDEEGEEEEELDDEDESFFILPNAIEVYPSDLHKFDVSCGVWTKIEVSGKKPEGRRSHSCVAISPFQFLLFGGYNASSFKYFSDLWIFDVRLQTWTELHIINPRNCLLLGPCDRRRQAMCYVEDESSDGDKAKVRRQIFIFGGTCPNIWGPLHFTDRQMRLMPNYSHLEEIWSRVDLDDLHVLDMNPSLKTLAALHSITHVKSKMMINSEKKREDTAHQLTVPSLKNNPLLPKPDGVLSSKATPRYYVERIPKSVHAINMNGYGMEKLPDDLKEMICNMTLDNVISKPLRFLNSSTG